MKLFQSRRGAIRLISFLTAFCILFAGVSLVQTTRVRKAQRLQEASSQRAMRELCENLDSITTNLQKGLYCNCASRLGDLALELRTSAACAKICLSQLTDGALISDPLYRFFSQVGDFTLAVDKKMQRGEPFSDDDRSRLSALYTFAQSLTDAVTPLGEAYLDGTVTLERTRLSSVREKGEKTPLFSEELNNAEQTLAEYPTLLYDGPFADAVLNRDALAVKALDEISLETAVRRAAAYLGCTENQLLRETDVDGTLPLFCFSRGERTVGITKRGGLLCFITGPGAAGAEKLDAAAAAKIARRYLRGVGYTGMRESYYSTYDGVCTVNLAFVKSGVTYYADLVKVSVALDTGAVVAVDARGYLMNHTARILPNETVTVKAAVRALAPTLTLLDTATAMIPCEDGRERLCHELHCKGEDGQQVLVYVDVTTGEEADLQLLTFSDGGVLAR